MTDLSIVIPARNEMFLSRTVEDIFANIEGDTEVIVVLDGAWANPVLPDDPRLTVLYLPESIGQRAATNQGVRLSSAKYVMKVDAHCAFDKGFDVKMMDDMEDDMTMIPTMRNLHVFDWMCDKCGIRWYQGPTPTFCCSDKDGKVRNSSCDSTSFHREMVWKPRRGTRNYFYRFDKSLHFQYWEDYERRPEAQGDLVETMSIQGSCFMMTRAKYWELGICDERHGSWGQQGVEVACKTWLSGGRVVTNKKTWYAHMFRTQGGDFGFPYPNNSVNKAREFSRDLWVNNKWPKAVHSLEWLLEKFAPVPDWCVSKGIVYYTDNELDETIMRACQENLKRASGGHRILSVSLKPMSFGDNITLPLKRGPLTMFKQILKGLEALDTDIVFFCEHDILYHPSHFDFIPPRQDLYYYNTNVWKVDVKDGKAMRTDDCRQLSGLCADRKLLVEHYKKRIALVEAHGFNRKMGFEAGTHNRKERVDDFKSEPWESVYPNIDLRHTKNMTQTRWSPEEFRDKRYTEGWKETSYIEGWGETKNIIKTFSQ